jgi:Galactose oxidase, central domain
VECLEQQGTRSSGISGGLRQHGEQSISFVWGSDTFQFDSEYKALGDFWIYSVNCDAWEQAIAQQHPNPGPWTGATLFVDDEANKVYLFGGFVDFSTKPPNNVWEFDFAMKQWSQLIANTCPNGLLPLGRNIASGGPIVTWTDGGAKKLVIYGGEGFNLTNFKFPILDDLWEFDLVSRSWKDIPVPSDGETPKRNYAGNVVHRDCLHLFGGDVAGTDRGICGGVYPENLMDSIWQYTTTLQWGWERIQATGDSFLCIKDQGLASVVNGKI